MRTCLSIIVILLFGTTISVYSQESRDIKVDGEFRDLSAVDFLKQLQKQVPVKIYYDPSTLDSININITAKGRPLLDFLNEAFKGTEIHSSIDRAGNVFIVRKFQVFTDLPANFFKATNNIAAETAEPEDYDIAARVTKKALPGKRVEIGKKTEANKPVAVLTGYVRNGKSGEPIINATVFTDDYKETAQTDIYGHYSLTLKPGRHTLNVQVTGMKDNRQELTVYSTGQLDVDLDEQVRLLKEVVVLGSKTSNVKSVQMGVERLSIEKIQKVPSVFGEADILRVVVSLPGVKTVGEASTGFNVRGGSADQNLILLNECTIYNPSHFFGMFSSFNPDVVKDIQLYKSSIPARYGGRLASVLDITSREGNKKNITGSAGIGVVTSRIALEGPLVKDKTSFILGARTTYANWLLKLLPDEFNDSKASFQDVNLVVSHKIDSMNNLYFTGYFSNDRFSLASDTLYNYTNRNLSLKWKHNFSNKFSGVFVAGYDQYKYSVASEKNEVNAFKLGFDINQFNFKSSFDLYINGKNSLDWGLNAVYYKLHPGYFKPIGDKSIVDPAEVEAEQALESGIYLTHRYNASSALSFNTGIRFSMFNYLGPKQVNYYAPGSPISPDNIDETVSYPKGKFIKTYMGPEFRFSVRYAFTPTFSIKAGYNSLRQYIHLLSNTSLIAPTDIWKLSDPNIKPQSGDQISLGFYKNLKSNSIETSVEVYYKRIKDYLDYKPGAVLFLNDHIETDVINTKAKAYGVEVLIKKPVGKLSGWLSYTYSRILLKAYDTSQGVLVNKGAYYPANYDKPHDVTLTGNFAVNHRFSVSLNTTYSTGRPITLPVGRYYYAGSIRVLYSDRNAHRIPDYFRIDISMNIDGNYKIHQKTHNSWTIGVYNLLGRKNPYSVYYASENGIINGYKLSIFGSVIPFVNYNIRF